MIADKEQGSTGEGVKRLNTPPARQSGSARRFLIRSIHSGPFSAFKALSQYPLASFRFPSSSKLMAKYSSAWARLFARRARLF